MSYGRATSEHRVIQRGSKTQQGRSKGNLGLCNAEQINLLDALVRYVAQQVGYGFSDAEEQGIAKLY